jgi:hypothetical protein
MNLKTAIAIAGLVAVAGILVAPSSLNVASAEMKSRCDTGDDDCPGRSDNPGQGHESVTCNDNNPDVCPKGQNKDD